MPAVDDTVLLAVFQKYVQFGQRNALATNVLAPQMDSAKFAKLVREAGLMDANVTLTEVDIVFSRVKDRNERKMSFLEFRTALKLLADKKYAVGTAEEACPGEEAEERVLAVVRGLEGPQLAAGTTTPEHSRVVDRLMVGPATYIGSSPRADVKSWRDSLRAETSRQSSLAGTPDRSVNSGG